jgi:hypothetical protein
MPKQRTIINVETHSLSVLRPARDAVQCWCTDCETLVSMVIPETAATNCATTAREIYRRIENGELHFLETPAGELFVCCPSLNEIQNQ